MKTIYEDGSLTIKEFRPTLFRLISKNKILKLKSPTRLLYLLKYLCGYKIYYTYNDREPVYYCFVSFGWFFKHPYVGKKDILIGPYFTKEEARGEKIAEKSLNAIMDNVTCRTAYVFVEKNNIPSQRVVLKCGFEQSGYGGYKGPFSVFKLSGSPDGNNFIVYTKKGKNG